MRSYLVVLILSLPLRAQQNASAPETKPPETKPEDRCVVEGQVLNGATGEPVKKASVIVRRVDLSPGTTGLPPSYTTATDAGGAFAMKDLDPGKYRLSVNRTGFVPAEYGARGAMRQGTTLSLEPKQHMSEVVVKLTPHAVITGRVVDEDHEPMANVQVQAMRYRYSQGRKQLSPNGGASTNDLGEYRMYGLAPGRYYLSATNRGGMMLEMSSDRSANQQQPDEDYVATYYPGTTDASTAAAVEVAPGAQLRGIDFALSKIRTVRVKGRVTNASGWGRGQVQLMLMPRDAAGFYNMNRRLVVDPKGAFEFRGMAAGSYVLTVFVNDGEKSYSARQFVDVGSNNVENLTMTIQPGMELTGHVGVDGQAAVNLGNVLVRLVARDAGLMVFSPTPVGRVKEDGTFTLSNVGADRFNFSLSGLPEGFYLKSIRSGDNDVLASGLDLSKGPAGPIEILLGPNAGQAEGAVQNDKQQPAAGATVVMIPQDKERRDQISYYKTVTTDQYGKFTLKNLDPGEYKVFAWEDVEVGAYMDPDYVKPVESQGESLTIRESSKERLELKLIPAAAR